MPFHWSNDPVIPNYGFARTRDLAFQAVRKLWKTRQGEGMTQADLAARLGRDKGWVSRKLSGPTNWTLRTFGDLVDALDGEVEIDIADLRSGKLVGNYDAYAGYGEKPVEKLARLFDVPKLPPSELQFTIEKPIGTNASIGLIES